jgi:hypothetical protein
LIAASEFVLLGVVLAREFVVRLAAVARVRPMPINMRARGSNNYGVHELIVSESKTKLDFGSLDLPLSLVDSNNAQMEANQKIVIELLRGVHPIAFKESDRLNLRTAKLGNEPLQLSNAIGHL